jgi:hypothetical protein
MFRKFERLQDGLRLYPLDWVSYRLEEALGVFAEMEGLPARQVFSLENFPAGLIGYQGATAFDFYQSRFRPTCEKEHRLSTVG